MQKDHEPVTLIIGAERKHGSVPESEVSWSVPGIISCTLGVVLTILGFAVPKLAQARGDNLTSTGMILFWSAVLFGLGAGAGLGLGGLMRARSSKLSPALGLLLNLAFFAFVMWVIAIGIPKTNRGMIRTIPSVTAPR